MCQDSADKRILNLFAGAGGYVCITVSTVCLCVYVCEASHFPSNELARLQGSWRSALYHCLPGINTH